MFLMLRKILRRIRLLLSDRRWFWFYLQRQFLDPGLRRRISRYLAKNFQRKTGYPTDLADVKPHVDKLALEGIAPMGQLLSASECGDLERYFSGCKVQDPYRPEYPAFKPGDQALRHPASHIAHHSPEDVLNAPYLMELVNSERLMRIASGFLGCKPTIGYLAAWWSYATGAGPQEAEHFHRDVDDWRFLKLFVYLSDVGLENGPHVYVRGSAVSKKLTKSIRRLDDDEVIASFGNENISCIPGVAGSAFFEDTFGIHKGKPVIRGSRLLFQAVYSMYPLPYGPSKPVLSRADGRFTPFDSWSNRVYLG